MPIQNLRHKLEQMKGEQSQIQREISQAKSTIRIAKIQQSRHERALEIVKEVGLKTQKALEYRLSEQVSLAEAAIFDDPYELVINFQLKRGKTEAEFYFKRRGLMISPTGNFVGHGAREVGGLGTRISYLTMRRDKKVRPVLILDEPFARLKGEVANRRALLLLNEISKELKYQIIMVSDERIPRDEIIENSNKTFIVTQVKGKSKIQEIQTGKECAGLIYT